MANPDHEIRSASDQSDARMANGGDRANGALSRTLLPKIPDHELLRCIGQGSYGAVWLARSVLGELRAIKVVYRQTFEHERPYEREFDGIRRFEPISRLHESQVDILHVGRNDEAGYFYYVMELADSAPGESEQVGKCENFSGATSPDLFPTFSPATYQPHTLKHDLYHHGRLSVNECISIGLALTTALDHLHSHGLVHRDVKPSNIIFVGGVPRLADIGLVASTDATMSFVGTSGFLPPEGPGTPQGDVYSLGKVLYEISMGQDRQEFPRLPPNLTEFEDPPRLLELNAVILKACHHDPRQRYSSAKEMAADLALLQRGKSVKQKRAFERRWKLAKNFALAAIVLALVFASATFALPDLNRNRPHSSSREAQNLYDHAVNLLHSTTLDQQLQAFANLTNAVWLDPKFADAYYMMFDIYAGDLGDQLPPHTNQMANFKWVRDKIKASDSAHSAQYHTVNSLIKFLDWDFNPAIDEVKLALKLDPKLLRAHVLYGWYMLLVRRDAATFRTEFKAADDGSDMIVQQHLGDANYFERKFPQAIAQYQNALRLESRASMAHQFLGHIYAAQQKYGEALDEYEAADRYEVADRMGTRNTAQTEASYKSYRSALAEKGPHGMWQAMLDDLRQSPSPDPYDEATFCARLGYRDEALGLLEKAYQQHSGGLIWLQIDDWWDTLRDDPRFKVLLEEMGFSKVVPARK